MGIFQYGLGGFIDLASNKEDSLEQRVTNLELEIVTARVSDINQLTGEVVAAILSNEPTQVGNSLVSAQPLLSNIKSYPLINEVIILLLSVSKEYQSNPNGGVYYYLTSTNLWGEVNSNPLPLPTTNLSSTTQGKSYQEVEVGSSNKSQSTNPEVFKVGTYFPEKGNVLSLLSFEGDNILEGRFGNSIRLGSTNISSSLPLNNWSTTLENGDPILILQNSLPKDKIIEDIGIDDSSIYLTSTQQLPITGSSTDYTSYVETQPIALNQYSGKPQIVLNSGRLVFNTTQDHLMLSSQKSINLNSIEGVNIDTRGNFIVQSPKVYLGDSEDSLTQPIVLGDDLVSLLTDVLDDLNSLTRQLQNQIGVPVGSPLYPTSLTAQLVADRIPNYKRRVNELLSNTTRTAV